MTGDTTAEGKQTATVDTRTPGRSAQRLDNEQVADHLDEVAALLADHHANPFRVRAYREASRLVRGLGQPVSEILARQGVPGLTRLPGIGRSLARSLEQLVQTGHLGLLDRMRGEADPDRLLATVGGIGPKLAEVVHDALGIESLADLEAAAWDGRLARVPGFGLKRVRGVRECLASRLRPWWTAQPAAPFSPAAHPTTEQPTVAELLDVDREYRQKVEKNTLPRVAPQRFNPTGQAWLPVLHTQRDARHYTALFSNTPRAHALGMTHDWVIIYRDDHDGDGQWTVITSHFGVLERRRIVRGREQECREYYR